MIERIANDLLRMEGCRLHPYRCTAGKLTIGIGRNIQDAGITKKEAELLLILDIDRIINQLDTNMPYWVSFPFTVKVVIIQMAFQLGIGGLMQFRKFLAALVQKNYDTAVKEMYNSRWAIQTPNRVKLLAGYLNHSPHTIQNHHSIENIEVIKRLANTLNNTSILT